MIINRFVGIDLLQSWTKSFSVETKWLNYFKIYPVWPLQEQMTCKRNQPFCNSALNDWILQVWRQADANKKLSCTAIFSIEGAQTKLIKHTPKQVHEKTQYWKQRHDRDRAGNFQTGTFREILVLESTNQKCQLDNFAFCKRQVAHQRDKIKDCSFWWTT